ncbi:MAG: N-acetylneuraminate synthase [Nitrospiraceae bacterium]|nr:MAG: N-acetylneuraminate synthase [Nitrospiraceae bacterium]
MKTFIIAEAGINHNGSVKIAKELVDAAAEAGADAVKFQTFKAEELAAKTAVMADYQIKNTGMKKSQYEMLRELELPEAAHRELFTYCGKKKIMFMSTPFDVASADFLGKLGMEIFKIPSGEITNKPLIQRIAGKKKPLILSTGMSYLGEVEKAIRWINEARGHARKSPLLTLLHCVSNYPAVADDVNLLAIKTMKNAFGLPVGYSDHTMGTEVPIAAAAIGATVIEKHFTLDRTMEGPDHKASLEPHELGKMVAAIRTVERAMGDGIKRPVASEQSVSLLARRSLVAARQIEAGSTINPDDIAVKRPGNGILPEFQEVIVGMKVRRRIEKDSVIMWGNLKDA